MSVAIRSALPSDIDAMTALLLRDAKDRAAHNPDIWPVAQNGRDKVAAAILSALTTENPPFRQHWLLAFDGDDLVGLMHTILLPVPPIYAGDFGPPGLIMEDSFLSPEAPADTADALLSAAEQDLRDAGAQILLASSVTGGAWASAFQAQRYAPLTLYLSKSDLTSQKVPPIVRPANGDDVPGIVALSADNRQVLFDLNRFWKPHTDADPRFGAWMTRSLTLPDRDMFVAEAEGDVEGYAISQPATPLHLPPSHTITETGIIDDFYHADLEDPAQLEDAGLGAAALLQAAESALAERGATSALVVCPAAWRSKIDLLEAQGYATEITWFIKS